MYCPYVQMDEWTNGKLETNIAPYKSAKANTTKSIYHKKAPFRFNVDKKE